MPDLQRQSPHETPMALVIRDKQESSPSAATKTHNMCASNTTMNTATVNTAPPLVNTVEAHSGSRSPGGQSSGCSSSSIHKYELEEEEKPLDLVVKDNHHHNNDSGMDDANSDHSDKFGDNENFDEKQEQNNTVLREEIRPQITLAKVVTNPTASNTSPNMLCNTLPLSSSSPLKIRDFARLESDGDNGELWRGRSDSSSSKKSSTLTDMSRSNESSATLNNNPEKPFVCGVCHKAYARKSHLHVHYRVHTGERPYVCKTCGRDFTEKRFLNDHVQTAHTGRDGPLTCPNCGREFAYKTSLKQHLKKQMCAKNLQRDAMLQANKNGNSAALILNANNNNNCNNGSNHGHSCSGSSSGPTKQFPCPFCDKSYSWKQTLKQHVSMYHRNKVHTDEFWRYELVKHRRVSDAADNRANDELWQRQIARHSHINESNSVNNVNGVNSVNNGNNTNHASNENNATNVNDTINNTNANNANNNTLNTENPPVAMETSVESGSLASQLMALHKWQSSLLSLAQKAPPPEPKSGALPNLTEESAAARTQMWLAQLGHYQEQSMQDELERSHDELWEQQIARIKSKPVKSPLEPVEINLDEEEEPKERQVVPMMSALQLHSIKMAAKARSEAARSEAAKSNEEAGPMRKRSRTLLSEDFDEKNNEKKEGSARKDSRSFLKSLLLDCFDENEYEAKRAAKAEQEEKANKTEDSKTDDNKMDNGMEEEKSELDSMSTILRKQLLGLDEQTKAYKSYHVGGVHAEERLSTKSSSITSSPKTSPKTSTSSNPSSYAHTSVLKHLLHRYNADHADEIAHP